MIFLIATLTIKPGSLPAIREAVMPCIEATRLEPGCISYDLHESITDPDTLVFVERWTNREALTEHFSAPHLIAWRDAGAGYFVDRKIEIIHPDHVEEL